MSDRIDEYHGPDAKPLTTADALRLEAHSDEDGCILGAVIIDREDLLATTRALETAQAALVIAASRADEARRSHERQAFEMEGKLRDEKARVDGIAAILYDAAVEAIVRHYWDASDEGQVRPGEIDAARAAIEKAKGATP